MGLLQRPRIFKISLCNLYMLLNVQQMLMIFLGQHHSIQDQVFEFTLPEVTPFPHYRRTKKPQQMKNDFIKFSSFTFSNRSHLLLAHPLTLAYSLFSTICRNITESEMTYFLIQLDEVGKHCSKCCFSSHNRYIYFQCEILLMNWLASKY